MDLRKDGIAAEELAHCLSGHWRYIARHLEHQPCWQTYTKSSRTWLGLEARPVSTGLSSEVLLISLFGHTLGHCGVAVQQGDRWLLHVGDAYYLRAEMSEENHPVSALAAQRADNDEWRKASLNKLRRLITEPRDEVEMTGYYDITELPTSVIPRPRGCSHWRCLAALGKRQSQSVPAYGRSSSGIVSSWP